MANMPTSSPHSSDGATHHETPSTNVTAFSPETVGTVNSSTSTQPRFKLSVTTDGPVSTQSVVAHRPGDDVFLNEPASTTTSSQLSPIASAFTPGEYLTSAATASRAGNYSPYMAGGNIRTGPETIEGATAVNNLLSGSVPDDLDARLAQYRATYPPVGPLSPMASLVENTSELVAWMEDLHTQLRSTRISSVLHNTALHEGTFSTDEQRGRAVLICGIPTGFPEFAIRSLITQQHFNSIIGLSLKDLTEHGVVIVGFSNIRDAFEVEQFLSNAQPNWTTRRISPKQYARQAFNNSTDMVSDYEAQLIITVFYDGNENTVFAESAVLTLKQTLTTFGYLKAIQALPASQQHAREFRVEYEDTRSALSALASLDHALIDELVLKVDRYQPDIAFHEESPNTPAGPPAGGLPPPPPPPPAGRGSTAPQVLSVTGRSLIPMPAYHSLGSRNNNLYSSPPRRGRDRYDANGNHNQVIIEKIEVGLDVRTTIMLRNIPNKIDSAMLKEILDETSHGAYDFMYLRIDFANNCNVGYAFINFVDALAIIPFARRRAGQRWNKYSSDKVAEISYATIQGKDCLVQKFRNSSVMLEDPSFRPKLFGTGTGPGAGDEEPFPGPDNVSKMRRSVENAEHVGLFVPNILDSPPTRTRTRTRDQRTVILPTPLRLEQPHEARAGTYLAPARASLPSSEQDYGRVVSLTMSRPPTRSFTTPAPVRQPIRPILTPSTSTESLNTQAYPSPVQSTPVPTGRVDTSRADDPFVGSRTIRQPTAPFVQLDSLFAPRQGQAFREEQRRRRSQFDRGTPGAEYEAYNYRLTDPALSPVRSPYTPRSTVYSNNLGSFTGAVYGPPTPRPGYGYY